MSSIDGVSHNMMGEGSQSRIKVNLSQQEDDNTLNAMNGLDEEPHVIQPKIEQGPDPSMMMQ